MFDLHAESCVSDAMRVASVTRFLTVMPDHMKLALAAKLVEDVAYDKAGEVDVSIVVSLIRTAAQLENFAERR
jgi:hypothetical protein